jgi:Rod binding domain-containing protein
MSTMMMSGMMNADVQSAMTLAQQKPVQAPTATGDNAKAVKAAKDFEAVLVTQMLGEMFSGVQTDGMFGGGQGEEMFRSLMLDQYGKNIVQQGGFGFADSIQRELVKIQEANHAPVPQQTATKQ